MKNCTFSLIVATYGRTAELARFLDSIRHQDFDLSDVEILIVDQNDSIDLSDIISAYQKVLRIVHIRTNVRGTSHSRNLGLEKARGEIIAFPDDDCAYYPDTLQWVVRLFAQHPDISCLSGRIYDREKQENILRAWGTASHRITWRNFYYHASAITKFIRSGEARGRLFCETLGPATRFGACEDTDYIVGLLKAGSKILYTPDIEVWHPKESINELREEKIRRYGMGFGGFCRKNLNVYIFLLFISAIVFHGLHYIFDGAQSRRKRRIYVQSRLQGWREWAAVNKTKGEKS